MKKSIWVVLFFGAVAAADWEVAPDLEGGMVSLDVRAAPMAMGATAAGTTHTKDETALTSRLRALARGLEYDPLKIFNYVRNEIAYEPGRGIYTGADGCFRVGKGNDWDQAALLTALLRASGIRCRYVQADIGYERSVLSNWLGVQTNQVVTLCASFGMKSGGVSNNADKAYIERCWVEASIDGDWKVLDPCFEEFEESSPVDLDAGSGYSRSDFIASITNGATQGTGYVQNLSTNDLSAKLAEYTTNLTAAIQQSYAGTKTDEAIFGRRKVKSDLSALPDSLPEPWYVWTNTRTEFNDVDDEDVLSIRMEYEGIDESLLAYEFFGKPLLITFNTGLGNRPELYLDGTRIGYGDSLSLDTEYKLTLSCEHPAHTADQYDAEYVQNLICGGKYNIIAQFMNNVSSRLIQEENSRLSGLRADYADDSLEVFGSSMRLMELYYFYQRVMISRLRGAICGVVPRDINQMGVCGEQNDGVFFDLPGSMSGSTAKDGDSSKQSIFYLSSVFMMSALEHGVLEQLQNQQGVSTARLLALSNAQGRKTYYADSSTWGGIQGSLTNYSPELLSTISTNISAGYDYVLPEDADITLQEWTGNGYVSYGESIANTPIGMKIDGGYSGGFSGEQVPNNPESTASNSGFGNQVNNSGISPSLSPEPVDLFTGNYVLEATDLTVGGRLPLGLQLTRSYSSGQNHAFNPLGYGWSHNLEMKVLEQSRPQIGLGSETPEQLSAQLVQSMITADLMDGDPGALEWLAASMVADWGMSQLTENIATATLEGKTHTFVKTGNGTYAASADGTASLVQTNGQFVFAERNGRTFGFDTNNCIETVSDPHGNEARFNWSSNRLDSVRDEYGRQFTFHYTSNLLTSVADNTAPARSIIYQHNTNSALTNITDAAGFNWHITCDSSNRIKTLTDPEDITTIRNFYNDIGQVTNQISATGKPWDFLFAGSYSIEENPLGGQTTHYFDSAGRSLGTKNALGNRTWKTYDSYGRLTELVTPNGVTNTWAYDPDHNLLAQTHAVGTADEVVTAYGYDSEHQLHSVTNALGTAEQTVTEMTYTNHLPDLVTAAQGTAVETTTDYDYTASGLLERVDEENGARVTTYSNFDPHGNAQTVQSTDAGTISRTFSARGDLKTRTLDGKTTAFGYNALRQPTAVTNALGTADQVVTSRTYYDNGLLKTATDARNEVTRHDWTPAYKPAGTVFPNLGNTTNLYDDADRLVARRDPAGNWTTHTLDAVGRIVEATSSSLAVTNQFDAVGSITNSAVDPTGLNLWTASTFDALNRLRNQQSSIGNRQFSYDALGRQTNTVDAASKHWKTEYDALGRIKKTFRPSENYEEYGYDKLGHRTHFWNAERKPMTFGVDAQGRVTSITNAIDKVTSFEYDDAGTLFKRKDAEDAETLYGYDSLNRLVAITNEGTWKASFEHDDNGNLLSAVDADTAIAFGYDAMNRLWGNAQNINGTTATFYHHYDANGNRTNIVYPGGLTASYEYGADNRLEDVTLNVAGGITIHFDYDTANRLTGISYPNGVTSTFGLDAEGRVTNIVHGTFIDRTIERNALGFKETELIDAGVKPTAPNTMRRIKTHNDADQLTQERIQTSVTNGTTIDYTYTDNGGLDTVLPANEASTSYTYDYDNRLKSVDDASSLVEYLYDASGARVGRIDGTSTNYFYLDYVDGLRRPLLEATAAGITRYYVWSGSQLLMHLDVTDTGSQITVNSISYYHADELGSTLALTDYYGNLTDEFAYMPYGETTHVAHAGSSDTPYQWLGGYGVYYDVDTQLHLTLHRAYSSSMKRFIQPDPLGIDGGVNVYMWANLNPLFFVDPYGLCAESFWSRAGSTAAGYAADALDFALPDAAIVGVAGNAGFIGALGGGLELVKNYKTGEVSFFSYGSKSVGWQLASGEGYTGVAWNLDENKDYAGQFWTAEGSGAVIGAGLSVSGNGSAEGIFATDPVVAVTVGRGADLINALTVASGRVKNSNYSDPKPILPGIIPQETLQSLQIGGATDTGLSIGHSVLNWLNEKAGR